MDVALVIPVMQYDDRLSSFFAPMIALHTELPSLADVDFFLLLDRERAPELGGRDEFEAAFSCCSRRVQLNHLRFKRPSYREVPLGASFLSCASYHNELITERLLSGRAARRAMQLIAAELEGRGDAGGSEQPEAFRSFFADAKLQCKALSDAILKATRDLSAEIEVTAVDYGHAPACANDGVDARVDERLVLLRNQLGALCAPMNCQMMKRRDFCLQPIPGGSEGEVRRASALAHCLAAHSTQWCAALYPLLSPKASHHLEHPRPCLPVRALYAAQPLHVPPSAGALLLGRGAPTLRHSQQAGHAP